MDRVSRLGAGHTNQEVVWLDITIDEGFLMNRLHARNLEECAMFQISHDSLLVAGKRAKGLNNGGAQALRRFCARKRRKAQPTIWWSSVTGISEYIATMS